MLWFSTVTTVVRGPRISVVEVPWLRLALHIDPTADPIAGTIGERGAPARAFSGWTQFGHVLGDVIAACAKDPVGHHDADPSLDKETS